MSSQALVCQNRKARHEYDIEDTFEAGIVLVGSEVKSLRAGTANLKDAYATIERGEVWLMNMHIGIYAPASHGNHEPLRKRKLLLHRNQIEKLIGKVREKGLTLVPLSLYFKGGRAKLELALARGKRTHDRREDVKKREMQREMAQAMRRRR
ncbi:MAG: SsrA-binding protein SmpB [bacterium]